MEEDDYTPILFPAYIEKEWKSRVLALYDGHSIITETGEAYVIHNFSTLLITVFEHNLLTFMLNLPTFPYLEQVIAMPGSNCCCTEQGKPVGIRLKGAKNTARWIVNAGAWGCEELTIGWLQLMRRIYERAGVGTPATPGALGSAIFRKTFKQQHGENWRHHRHRRPPGPYAEQIRVVSSGARSEVFHLNVMYKIAYENDQHNGYGAALLEFQPTGKTYRVRGKAVRHYPMYFVECEVTIHESLLYGVFPMRVSDGNGRNTHPIFPRSPGVYRAWLWKEEIDLCQQEGLTVSIKSGFAWKEVTDDFGPMVQELARLRDESPESEAGYFKLALVAFTGTLGMPTERYNLVSGDERKPGDRAIGDAGTVYDWWIHAEQNPYPQSMPHIFSHTLMLCRLSLFGMMKQATLEELNIIATNTDAVVTEKKSVNLPVKGTPVNTGEWTSFELHDVVVKANRHLDSREKSVHPGIPKNRATIPKNR